MSRRLSLVFVVLLCLGLSLPALAEPGQGGGQGGGPPSTSHPAGPPTTVTATGNGNGGPPTTVTATGNGNGGPPTTVTAPGNGQGNGNGQGGPPTTVTTHASGGGGGSGSGSGSGSGQGNGPPSTVTTHASNSSGGGGTGQGNGPPTTVTNPGNSNGNGTGAPTTSTPEAAPAKDSGAAADRIAVFLAPIRVSQESDSSQPVAVGEAQSAPGRMISWLLSANERRFLPVIASPLVALVVVGRALASAGSGAVAPIALLVALAMTKLLDRRRGQRLASIPAS